MTVTVTIKMTEGAHEQEAIITLSASAEEAIRFAFNPSGLPDVHVLKALAGAFITKCEEMQAAMPHAGREFAVAKTEMQTASMWSVLGTTKQRTT